ncbi:uncharacterized protein PV07_03038 [Cladophialophora immunda]|uniref:Uncharacterized protein n=1 Tax=Cladophialophora immunda TaxID=569365 RepID=A0A0D1ZTH0_9EURO|nr:uncharacterized protein PV07_03038 [Cladophialophora immunda]KIW31386.1 hypothetical protein PV07_03038 [Cladophialophora immunda]OQV06299.1 hypothetical protein CLAIMM_10885 [Cladophialophora immunda]
MGRGPRRHLKDEDDESEDENLPPMSPNTQKEHQLKMIMRMDLSEKNADAIKTSDYSSRPRPFAASSITPECNVEGTEAARIAKENSGPTSKWQTFGQSDEAVDALFTQKQISNGNSHRHTIEEQKREEEGRLGHKLKLEDTYNDFGGSRRAGKRVASLHSRPPAASSAHSILTTRSFSATSKESTFGNRGKGVQAARPWPPPGLEGTPSMAIAMQISQPSAKTNTVKMSAMSSGSQVAAAEADPKRRALAPPAKSRSFALVEDSSKFMSSIQGKLAAWSSGTQTEAHGTSTSAANAAQTTWAVPSAVPVAQDEHTSAGHLHDSSIRRVPVAEFSFSVASTLAPGNVATHTDGAPSPAALSGFSTSTADDGESLPQVQAVTNDLIGLAIEDASLPDTHLTVEVHSGGGAAQAGPLSPSGSILDSPILDQVSSEVLPAEAAKVVIVGGLRYVLESELLDLKAAVENQLNSTTASLVNNSPALITAPKAVSVPQPFLASSKVTSSVASTAVRPSCPVNPFAPREPLATNDTNIAAAQVSSSNSNKDSGGPSTTAKSASRPSSVVTSNTTIISKWADDPSSRPTSRPAAPVIRSSSPIFGDRKVFGHHSKEAAEGQKYEPPPPKIKRTVATKRQYEPPGPGLTWLLKEMADAKQKRAAADEMDEEL